MALSGLMLYDFCFKGDRWLLLADLERALGV